MPNGKRKSSSTKLTDSVCWPWILVWWEPETSSTLHNRISELAERTWQYRESLCHIYVLGSCDQLLLSDRPFLLAQVVLEGYCHGYRQHTSRWRAEIHTDLVGRKLLSEPKPRWGNIEDVSARLQAWRVLTIRWPVTTGLKGMRWRECYVGNNDNQQESCNNALALKVHAISQHVLQDCDWQLTQATETCSSLLARRRIFLKLVRTVHRPLFSLATWQRNLPVT